MPLPSKNPASMDGLFAWILSESGEGAIDDRPCSGSAIVALFRQKRTPPAGGVLLFSGEAFEGQPQLTLVQGGDGTAQQLVPFVGGEVAIHTGGEPGATGELLTAEAVGERLSRLSQNEQVMVVTHSPQVASFGNEHFKVEKLTKDDITTTHLTKLNKDGKIEEIARMLAGETITKEARAAAVVLLEKDTTPTLF